MNELEIKYKSDKIQQILEILDSIPLAGFINHQKMVAIIGILNEPFKKENSKTESEINKTEE